MAKIVYIEPSELPKPKADEPKMEPCASCGSHRTKFKTVLVPFVRITNVIYCRDCADWDYSKAELKQKNRGRAPTRPNDNNSEVST